MTARRGVTDDVAVLQRAFAEEFTAQAAEVIARRGRFIVALPGGSVATTFLPVLAGLTVDWPHIDLFWIDERAVPPDHPDSNYGIASRVLLTPARVPASRIRRAEVGCRRSAASGSRARRRWRRRPCGVDFSKLVRRSAWREGGHAVRPRHRRTRRAEATAAAADDDAARSCQCRDRRRRRIRRGQGRGDARRDRRERSDAGSEAPSRRAILASAPRSRSGTIIGAYFSWRRVSCVRCFSP